MDEKQDETSEERKKRIARERTRKWRIDNPEKARELDKRNREKRSDAIRLYNKAWYEANKEKAAEKNKQWKIANPEKVKATRRKWKIANPEKVAEKDKRWAALNRERKLECARKRYRKNLDKHRERLRAAAKRWRLANPDRYRFLHYKNLLKRGFGAVPPASLVEAKILLIDIRNELKRKGIHHEECNRTPQRTL